jgi:transcriptional regulator of acetoin/glycerol metabolism
VDGLKELLRLACDRGVRPEDLDELVHELKSEEAAEINNAGLEAQLAYILEACGGRVEVAAELIGVSA